MKAIKIPTVLLDNLECYKVILRWIELFLFYMIDNLTYALKVIMIRNVIPQNWHLLMYGFWVIRRNFAFAEEMNIWTSVLNPYKAYWYLKNNNVQEFMQFLLCTKKIII